MMGARGKEIQINVTLVQDSVCQKLGEKLHLCSLVYIMQCFLSGGGTLIGHTKMSQLQSLKPLNTTKHFQQRMCAPYSDCSNILFCFVSYLVLMKDNNKPKLSFIT